MKPPESPRKKRSIAARCVAAALREFANLDFAAIEAITGVKKRTLQYVISRAKKRGFDPSARPIQWNDDWFSDGPRLGRPLKKERIKVTVADLVRANRHGREKSTLDLSEDLAKRGIKASPMTVWRVLRSASFRKTKPTRKPGLSPAAKAARLQWCLERKDWTLEDWKKVIWSDETAIVLGSRRGYLRVWRTPEERVNASVIRARFAGYSQVRFSRPFHHVSVMVSYT